MELKHCNKCGLDKTLDLMRKEGGGKYKPVCKMCDNVRKQAARDKQKLVNQKLSKVEVYVPKFVVTKYVPETVYVRNEGLKHIPSRGFAC